MKISVETQTSGTFSVNVEEEATVREAKEALRDVINIPLEQQTLIYNGKELRDEETLDKCGVYREATLQLVVNKSRSTTL